MTTKIYFATNYAKSYVLKNLFHSFSVPDNFIDVFENSSNYRLVYTYDSVATNNEDGRIKYLDYLYDLFNCNNNSLKTIRNFDTKFSNVKQNMSIGDVIIYQDIAYVCMGCGFKRIN